MGGKGGEEDLKIKGKRKGLNGQVLSRWDGEKDWPSLFPRIK
jgi:hypothetical protein